MLSVLVVPLWALLAPSEPLPGAPRDEPPAVSAIGVTFAFEPRIGNYGALDDDLQGYGFAPVGSPFIPAWGLRGRMLLRNRMYVGMSMTYGLIRADHPSSVVPTTTTLVDSAVGIGYGSRRGLMAGLDLGFAAMTHAVGSSIEGGALVYLGPSIHPRVGWAFVGRGPMVAITVGYNLHVPVGAAHAQPLWEAPFARPAVHALTMGIESGFGWRMRPAR